jgi:hypothetical protein
MSRWFRHYAGLSRDEKLVRVAIRSKQTIERVIWIWGAILESAAEINDNGKYDFDVGEASYFLRADEGDVGGIVDALEDLGRIHEGTVVHWGDRQFQSDTSAERQKRYRDRKKTDNGHNSDHDVTVSSRHADTPDTELELEPDIIEDRSSLRSDPSAEGADLFPAEKIDRAKAKADARRIELKSFGEAWNDIAADHRLPEIDSIDPGSTRERQALATLKWLRDHDSEPQAFFAKIRAGPYLLGEVNGFRASFDWVCKAANRQKIMDGNYENREKAKSFVDQFRAPHIAR